MTMNWRPAPAYPGTNTFEDRLYYYIKPLEAQTDPAKDKYYLDLHLVNGNLTIGVGFDLKAGGYNVRKEVFASFGLDIDYPIKYAGAQPGTPQAIESEYISSLIEAVQKDNIDVVNNIMGKGDGHKYINIFSGH